MNYILKNVNSNMVFVTDDINAYEDDRDFIGITEESYREACKFAQANFGDTIIDNHNICVQDTEGQGGFIMETNDTYKVFARQVDPSYQDSYFDAEGCYPDIVFKGNRNYSSHWTPEYQTIDESFDTLCDYLEEEDEQGFLDMLDDEFKKTCENPAPYTEEEIAQWKKICWELIKSDRGISDKNIAIALSLMTGHTYEYDTLRGCCQGDWQEIFYPTDLYSHASFASNLSIEYFNTGTEWIVYDEEGEPEDTNFFGYSVYCYTYDPKKELAEYAGVKEEEVRAWEFEGYTRTPKYKLI